MDNALKKVLLAFDEKFVCVPQAQGVRLDVDAL
jgi:hypothetical protein